MNMQFFRVARPVQIARYARKFSGHSDAEHKIEVDKWFKISIGAVAFSTLATAYILITDEHVHAERPDLHLFKTKPFPWKCRDCSLFEPGCWDECLGRSKKSGH